MVVSQEENPLFGCIATLWKCLNAKSDLYMYVEQREEEEKNVKAVAESVASNNNAPASTLGDNNDILAGLKAKMEKSEKKK